MWQIQKTKTSIDIFEREKIVNETLFDFHDY